MKLIKPVTFLLTAAIIGSQLFACGKSGEETFYYSKGLDKNGYFENVKASDIVKLPEYKGIDIDASILIASDEALQEQITGILEGQMSYEQIMEGTVKDGDTINIDYEGSIDGIPFEGGSTEGYGTNVTIGVTSYIDDFLEQLIGHKPGENFDIEVTFPENYGNQALNGKDAVFNITINYIQGEPIEAQLTEAIAAEYGFDSVEAMIEDIKEWLIANQKFNLFIDILLQATCENIPQSVIDYVIESDLYSYSYYASLYGVTVEQLLIEQFNYSSLQEYIDDNLEIYKENALQYLAAQAIAELEGLTASDADITEAGYDVYIEEYGLPYLKQFLLFQEIIPDFIISSGVVK